LIFFRTSFKELWKSNWCCVYLGNRNNKCH